MRRADVGSGGAPSPLSSDLHRDLGARVGQLGQAGLEGLSVWIARRVLAHRFVDWVRNSEDSVVGHLYSSLLLLLLPQIVSRPLIPPWWQSCIFGGVHRTHRSRFV